VTGHYDSILICASEFSMVANLKLLLPVAASIAFYLLLLATWKWFRQQLLAKEVAHSDLPFLGVSRDDKDKIKGTAVICGGR